MWSGRAGGFDDLVVRLPGLAERIAGAPVASRDAGAGPFGGRARNVVVGRTALVGDAACCLDPITGEGLSLAFESARALVAAVVAGRLGRYRREQSRLVRPARRLNRLVLLLAEAPRLRARVVRALASRPDAFDRLLGARRSSIRTTGGALLRLSLRVLATEAE
jgi:flavin-dependent dehydrogenase